MADAQKNLTPSAIKYLLTLPETCVPWPLASSGIQMIV